jgi:dipeptidase E
MRRLLLVSSSFVHGTGYLDHCEENVKELFSGIGRALFVPYALPERDAYADKAQERFQQMGFELEVIHRLPDPVRAVEECQGLFIGGGNTFRLLKTIYDEGLVEPIRRRVFNGVPYMGTSAGSNVACATIKTTNDMPVVYPPTFEALRLVPFQLNPHYIDPDAASTHMGETRDVRLDDYLKENDLPVVALREGAMLMVEGHSMILAGDTGAKLFQRDRRPLECPPGTELGFLLEGPAGSRPRDSW